MAKVKAGAKVKRIIQEFDPAELWEHCAASPCDGAPGRRYGPGDYKSLGSVSFEKESTGGADFDKALELARYGWPEGLEKIAPLVAQVGDLMAKAVPVKSLEYAVAGEAPDMGALMAGVPEHMLAIEETEGAQLVRVALNCAVSGGVSSKTIEKRGAVTCALIDALERAGYRVEVALVFDCENRAGSVHLSVRTILKRAEEPLVLDRLAFALIHPAMLRRLMLRCIELRPETEFPYYSGSCRPGAYVGAPGEVVMGEMYGGAEWTIERMADEVARYLEEIGVKLDRGAL